MTGQRVLEKVWGHTYLGATAFCLQSPQQDLAAGGCSHHLVMLAQSPTRHAGSECQAFDGPVQAGAGKHQLPARCFLQPVGWKDVIDLTASPDCLSTGLRASWPPLLQAPIADKELGIGHRNPAVVSAHEAHHPRLLWLPLGGKRRIRAGHRASQEPPSFPEFPED